MDWTVGLGERGMNYEDARWLFDVYTQEYRSQPHRSLQVEAASLIANYGLENGNAYGLRDSFASFQFKFRIMEILREL